MSTIDTKQRLMETALELIWNSNYDRVGIAEICQKAGVTKGAFYHHFSSKADLFVCASEMEWDQKSREMDEILSPRYDALEQLEKVINLILHKQVQICPEGTPYICGSPIFTAGAQAGCGCNDIQIVAKTMSENAARYFGALVRNLAAEGYLDDDMDALEAGRLAVQYVQGVLTTGRICQNVEEMTHDLRQGLYRILNVKAEYRKTETTPMAVLTGTDS
jgi:TetR/AcrR family transcriptional repressor of nem operon